MLLGTDKHIESNKLLALRKVEYALDTQYCSSGREKGLNSILVEHTNIL